MVAPVPLVMLALAADSTGVPEVRLPPSIHVHESRLTLGNIGAVETASKRCRALLEHFDLGPAPMPGASMIVRASEVEALVDSHLPADGKDCIPAFEGERSEIVSSEGEAVDMDQLQERAADALESALGGRYEQVAINRQPGSLRPLSVLPGTRYDYVPQDSPRPRAKTVVDVIVHEPGHPDWRYPIWFDVQASQRVWQLDESVADGRCVDAVKKHLVLAEFANLRAEAVPADFAFEQQVAARPLSPGEILTRDDLTRAPDVSAGKDVVLRFRARGIEVQTQAVALESGNVGDHVRVRNKRSNEETAGTVDGRNDVQVSQ